MWITPITITGYNVIYRRMWSVLVQFSRPCFVWTIMDSIVLVSDKFTLFKRTADGRFSQVGPQWSPERRSHDIPHCSTSEWMFILWNTQIYNKAIVRIISMFEFCFSQVSSVRPRDPATLRDVQLAPDGRQLLAISSNADHGLCFACLSKGLDRWIYYDYFPSEVIFLITQTILTSCDAFRKDNSVK